MIINIFFVTTPLKDILYFKFNNVSRFMILLHFVPFMDHGQEFFRYGRAFQDNF